ncbi:MAG: hypothetical protein N2510_00560 [Ignavibacteria bacterium]|nr:hypothetical protein [Ignavibacteria bacterium]
MKKAIIFITVITIISACSKKDDLPEQQKGSQEIIKMPDDSIHRNIGKNKGDEKADELIKSADEADSLYSKTKSESDKKACIEKHMAAANYLMFEANLSPKKKYPPALRRYRRVLELDPSNKEAAENKKEIEDIYISMGMPIPD